MPEGEIIKLVRHRGFGFLNSNDVDVTDGDIFFHHSSLEDLYFEDLKIGDQVKFELIETPKGPEAVNISKIVQTTELYEDADLSESSMVTDEDMAMDEDMTTDDDMATDDSMVTEEGMATEDSGMVTEELSDDPVY